VGVRSKVLKLPEATRVELDSRLIRGGFSGYEELEAWLRSQGYEVGKSSIHRYGSKLDQRIAELKRSTDQAKALVAAAPDDSADMSEALMRLLQEKLFTLLMEMEVDPENANLAAIAKAMAPLARASISLKKYASEVQAKLSEASAKVSAEAASGRIPNLTAEALARIREIYTGAVTPP
jgi:hypothetical protein